MAVSQECLDGCREKLLEMRAEKEEEIKRIGQEPLPQREDFHRRIGFKEVMATRQALFDVAFALLRKINLRIEAIKTGAFLGVCPNCRKDIEEEHLLDNPLRVLCVDCQREENGKQRQSRGR